MIAYLQQYSRVCRPIMVIIQAANNGTLTNNIHIVKETRDEHCVSRLHPVFSMAPELTARIPRALVCAIGCISHT